MKKLTLILLLLQLCMGYSYAQGQRGSLRQRTGSLKDKVDQAKKDTTSYDSFVNQVNANYQAFRDSVNAQYAAFMEKVWKDYPIEEAEKFPEY